MVYFRGLAGMMFLCRSCIVRRSVWIFASASAHFRGCECALTGPRLRTLGPASARSFFTPSTHTCRGIGRCACCRHPIHCHLSLPYPLVLDEPVGMSEIIGIGAETSIYHMCHFKVEASDVIVLYELHQSWRTEQKMTWYCQPTIYTVCLPADEEVALLQGRTIFHICLR